jgi:nitrogen fixation NifU-like protein
MLELYYMDIYREKLLDHYNNPRNFGKLVDANAIMELENVSCGDSLKMQLKLEKGNVKEVMFTGEGCAVSIASASILTEYIKGKTIKEVKAVDLDKLLDLLGVKLTISRLKCANLSLETVQAALEKP